MNQTLQLNYQQETYTIQLPDDVPLYQLTPALAQKLDLPQQHEDGTVYLYYLLHGEEPVDPTQTLQQLPYADREYTLAYREVARPELEQLPNSRQTTKPHLRITAQDIADPILVRRRPRDIPPPNRLRMQFLPLLAIIFLVCGVSVVTFMFSTSPEVGTVAPPPTNTPNSSTVATAILPTNTPAPPPNGNYELEGMYEKTLYSSAANSLLAYSPNGTILSIYDLDWTEDRRTNRFPRSFNGEEYISYVSFDSPIQDLAIANENSLKVLVTLINGRQLLTLLSENHFAVQSEEDACRYISVDEEACFTEPTPDYIIRTTDTDCQAIWENEDYYLNECAQIFQKSGSLLFGLMPIGSEVIDWVETSNGQLLVLGKTHLAIYNTNSMTGDTLSINNIGRWTAIEAQTLFVDRNAETVYVVYQPEEAATNWLWVADIE